jgi:Luciferase-like monooxygenase
MEKFGPCIPFSINRRAIERCKSCPLAKHKELVVEIGIDSFAAILPDPATGKLPSATDRMADLLEEIEVADRVGLDVFGMGEHHRAEFLDSAPAIILAAAAARTKTIRLTSAVTVLSAADPVLSGIRDPRPDRQRSCRNRRRPGLLRRGLSVVRFPDAGL